MNLFHAPTEDHDVSSITYIDYRPVSSPHPGAPITFYIPGESHHYVDLRKSKLITRWSIVDRKGEKNDTGKPVTAANLAHHTMWADVDISLQHKHLHSCGPLYPYKAYLETLLNTGEDCKNTQLRSEFWFKDDAGQYDTMRTTPPKTNPKSRGETALEKVVHAQHQQELLNEGYVIRDKLTASSATVDTQGPLHLDICQQDRPILDGVNIGLKLWPAKDSFILLTGEKTEGYMLKIEDIVFRVCKLELSPSAMNENERSLQKGPAKYPMQKTVMKNYNIAIGQTAFSVENLYQGDIPTKLFVFMVKGKAFDGNYDHNPLYFKHFHVTSIAFYIDGESVPAPPQITNFRDLKQLFTTSYDALFSVIGQERCDYGNGLTQEDYFDGATIFAFDLPHRGLTKKKGHTRLDIRFGGVNGTESNVVLLTYATFPSMITIDKNRQIHES